MTKEIGTVPSPFNEDTHTALGWSLQMEAYLHLNDGVYDNDKRKVIFFLSRMMKGEAAKWAEGHLNHLLPEECRTDGHPPHRPPSFSKAKDPYVMDIDHMEMEEDSEGEKRTRKMYLTPQEHKCRHKNGLCFKCGKKGLTKDCPNHPTMMTAKKVVKESNDDNYAEFLKWKAFKARQAKKGKAKKEESKEEDF
ncbi:hypothetical protein CY34DRAFT_16397 [Suillus luteus UH-Slu-Lm8-n1]|uniref:CCHC-type domain-containing protein n=1 Tax=Suillus luteus UH-Slu-Lm8-n1 TaxID=930992 RepID=A0A0D0A436_9AGAM|nr:hypothetical protein CY34DRAFT_16397 [Suillus luteus UH-Slu-Lm8-n1]